MRITRMLPFLDKKDKILDLGCGNCCVTKHLKDIGYLNIHGLDVVNKGTCLKPQIYNGSSIPYPDNEFDVVICSFILHHIPNYNKLLDEIKRVCKKYIIIFEDTPENKIDNYFTKYHAKSDWGKCHKCFNNKEEWINIFQKKYLKIREIEDISRFEFPFSDKPYIYPVPASLFILET